MQLSNTYVARLESYYLSIFCSLPYVKSNCVVYTLSPVNCYLLSSLLCKVETFGFLSK